MSEITIESERAKYLRVWEWNNYRRQADGDAVVDMAFEMMGCKRGETLIDWGCGTGMPAQKLAAKGLKVTGFDIAENCLNAGINIPLVVGCLWEPPAALEADYGFCTDVLEHLPEDRIQTALGEIKARSRKAAFIQVDTVLDISGPRMDPPLRLHLTVKPCSWWQWNLERHWNSVTPIQGTYSRWAFLCR